MSNTAENINSRIISENPLLDKDEERQLIETVSRFKSGKKHQIAREKLFNSNIRLVIKEAHRLGGNSNVPIEDLIQAGYEGLCIAIDRFDPSHMTKFSTYAVPWIRLKIFRIMESYASMVYIPRHINYQSHKYRKTIGEQDADRNLTDKELMNVLDVTERGLRNIRLAQHPVISMNESRYNDEESGGEERTVQDFIADVKSPMASNVLQHKDRRDIIRKAIKKLSPIHQDIINSRFFKCKKDDLGNIGKRYSITGERVRQLERDALRKMRRYLKDKTQFLDV